jgi:hypothetical protein
MYGNFSPDAIEAFTEAVGEENFSETLFDFTTCIRPDGSAYGTGGKCRKGTEGEAKVKDGGKGEFGSFDKLTQDQRNRRIKQQAELVRDLKKEGDADWKSERSRLDRMLDKDKEVAAKKPEAKSQTSLVTPQKQGQADLDRLNKYIKEEATKFDNQRKAIRDGLAKADDPGVKKNLELRMRNVREASKQRDQLQKETEKAASTQSPQRPADNSPAAQQRRVAAALRAKD